MRDELDRWLMRNPPPTGDRSEFFARMPAALRREWDLRKAKELSERPEFGNATAKRATKRMARVDQMLPEVRALVYEYGLEIVQEFLNCGVKAKHIAHLIDTVRHEQQADGNPRFKLNKGPNKKRNPAEDEYWSVRP